MISVIIPVHNGEAYLAAAIESALAQTLAADQIVVVDDASTDASAAIARRYPVQLVALPENRGHAYARNRGLEAARGDLIAWLDADDYWESNHLETVAALLQRFPEAAVAYSRVRYIGSRRGHWPHLPCCGEPRRVFAECFHRTIVPAMSCVVRKELLLAVGGFDASLPVAPDFDLWLRLSRRYPFVCTEQVTANYRWHPRQLTNQRGDDQLLSKYIARRKMLELVEKNDGPAARDELAAELLNLWLADLQHGWKLGYHHRLRRLLDLAPQIPGALPYVRPWQVKALIPHFLVRFVLRLQRRCSPLRPTGITNVDAAATPTESVLSQ